MVVEIMIESFSRSSNVSALFFSLDRFSKETTAINQIFGGLFRSQGLSDCMFLMLRFRAVQHNS